MVDSMDSVHVFTREYGHRSMRRNLNCQFATCTTHAYLEAWLLKRIFLRLVLLPFACLCESDRCSNRSGLLPGLHCHSWRS